MTARHCLWPPPLPTSNFTININGTQRTVVKSFLFNCNLYGTLKSGNDMAIMKLDSPVTHVAPMPFDTTSVTSSNLNRVVRMAGWGDWGPAGSVKPTGCMGTGVRGQLLDPTTNPCLYMRTGQNIVDKATENKIGITMNSPGPCINNDTYLMKIWDGDECGDYAKTDCATSVSLANAWLVITFLTHRMMLTFLTRC